MAHQEFSPREGETWWAVPTLRRESRSTGGPHHAWVVGMIANGRRQDEVRLRGDEITHGPFLVRADFQDQVPAWFEQVDRLGDQGGHDLQAVHAAIEVPARPTDTRTQPEED